MLRTYRTFYSTVGFSKYEFNNKLLGDATFLRIITRCHQVIFILFLNKNMVILKLYINGKMFLSHSNFYYIFECEFKKS